MPKPLVLCLKGEGWGSMLKQLDVDWIALEYKKSGDASERDFLPSSKTAVAAKSHNGVVHWISHGMRFVSKGSSVTTASSLILYFTSDGSKARYVPLNSLAKLILSTQSQVAAVILHACNAGGGGDKSAVAKLKDRKSVV